jgi:prepilin-type N-terminal cleavage/methylation domain-containing protein
MKTTESSSAMSGGDRALSGRWRDGFTFVEILVASAIAAVTIAVAALAFSTITTRAPSIGDVDVTLPSGMANNFYGIDTNVVAVGSAPSFTELGRAEALREILEDDLRSAVFTVCLARNGQSSYRPTNISPGVGFDARVRARPADFRAFLQGIGGGASFIDYEGPATGIDNVSMFIFQPSTNAANFGLRAIYESDIVPTTSPPGVYGSVRRYAGGVLTDFYHVFYPDETASEFSPPVTFFDRTIVTSTNSPAAYRQAPNSPFYFLWWPDPVNYARLHTNSFIQQTNSSQPRSGYWQMAYRTSYFFVIPAFPAL